jgi:DNA-binding NtrC family response regulator
MPGTGFDLPALNGFRVLVVDDLADQANTTATLLMLHGFEVRTAGTVAEARSSAPFAPHVVVADLGLPDGDGADLVAWAGSLPAPAAVVVVTGHTVPARLLKAQAAGAATILLKPVDPVVLADHARRLCGALG